MKVLFSFLIVCSIFVANAQNTLTPEILWKLNRVSGGTVSPDGNYLLYSQRSFNMDENKGNTDLYVLDLKTNKSRQITETPFSEFEAQWGKNNRIWFMSTEKDGVQIWNMNNDGTEKQMVSNFVDAELEGFKLAPNESFVITIEAVKVNQTVNDKYPDLKKANARIEDDLMYRHWDHFDDYKKKK